MANKVWAAENTKWRDYRVIMWIGNSAYKQPEKLPLFFQRLREMGVTTGMVHGEADPKPMLDAGLPYYVENLVNRGLCLKWNSKVADWDKHVTAYPERVSLNFGHKRRRITSVGPWSL